LFGNGLAWVIATQDESSAEDRAKAVEIAEAAAKKTNYQHPQVLDTLAAAYAASGDFEQAVAVARRAIERAKLGSAPQLAEEIGSRLLKYRNDQPYRESHPPAKK
jgi:tetratricopeptide (TPR) repeat protein